MFWNDLLIIYSVSVIFSFVCENWIQNTFLSTIQQQDSNHTPKGEFCDRMFTNCESIETYERNHTSVTTAYKLWSQREGVRTIIDIGNCRQRCLYDVFCQIYQFSSPLFRIYNSNSRSSKFRTSVAHIANILENVPTFGTKLKHSLSRVDETWSAMRICFNSQ